MNTCSNCGKVMGLHSSILQGCMCQYSMQAPPQRTWVGLEKSDMPDGADPLFDDPKFIAGMVYAANKLKEKNNV